jgi:hypothetical protein
MKLSEIKPLEDPEVAELLEIFMQNTEYPELSKDVLAGHSADAVRKIVPLENGQYELRITSKGANLFEADKFIGFIHVHGHDVAGNYIGVDLIYAIPAERNGKAMLMMLNGLRGFMKRPLLVTGAVFSGGVKMLKNLKRRGEFRVSVIDLDTGKLSPYEYEDINDESKGLVVEGFGWPAYMNYRHAGHDTEICTILFEEN